MATIVEQENTSYREQNWNLEEGNLLPTTTGKLLWWRRRRCENGQDSRLNFEMCNKYVWVGTEEVWKPAWTFIYKCTYSQRKWPSWVSRIQFFCRLLGNAVLGFLSVFQKSCCNPAWAEPTLSFLDLCTNPWSLRNWNFLSTWELSNVIQD